MKWNALAGQDGWGREFRLIRRAEKASNSTGYHEFNFFKVCSAGADGKFGTTDDFQCQHADEWTISVSWHIGDGARAGRRLAQMGMHWGRGKGGRLDEMDQARFFDRPMPRGNRCRASVKVIP